MSTLNFADLGSFSDLLHALEEDLEDSDSTAPISDNFGDLASFSDLLNAFEDDLDNDSTASIANTTPHSGTEVENKKKTRGRCKIPMTKIASKNKKHVAFSKRRAGLFKKASELSVLTGAQIAIVTFSDAGKVFSFGHPCVDSVIGRYLQSTR